jgi:RES domain-containing protein
VKALPPATLFAGLVYRAHNPRWAYVPTSGEGAARHGGRFNPRGVHALYTALDLRTAWLEAQQGFAFKAQPMTLVAYRVECERIADLTDAGALAEAGIAPEDLACPWEDLAARGLTPPTWVLATALIASGYEGILIPSFAPGTLGSGRNLVLWRWGDGPPCKVRVVDDFGRLPGEGTSRQSAGPE